MTEIEPRPIDSSLEPVQPRALTGNDLIRRVATDLTPFQAVRVGRKIARSRMGTAVELARIEDKTILAEARVIARGKVRTTEEQVEALVHAERLDCLARTALRHEETSRLVDLVSDEDAHSIFKAALKAASTQYVAGVSRRTGS